MENNYNDPVPAYPVHADYDDVEVVVDLAAQDDPLSTCNAPVHLLRRRMGIMQVKANFNKTWGLLNEAIQRGETEDILSALMFDLHAAAAHMLSRQEELNADIARITE